MDYSSVAHLPTDVSALRRRRGTTSASITKLGTMLRDLESRSTDTDVLSARLQKLDSDFKFIHFQIVDHLPKAEDLDAEQDRLDEHEDKVSDFSYRLNKMVETVGTAAEANRKDNHLEENASLREESCFFGVGYYWSS